MTEPKNSSGIADKLTGGAGRLVEDATRLTTRLLPFRGALTLAQASRFRARKPGQIPGTLVHFGRPAEGPSRIDVVRYTDGEFEELERTTLDHCPASQTGDGVTWISIVGLQDVETIRRIGERYGVHPLVLEDILNTHHRPKIEPFDEYALIILKVIDFDDEKGVFRTDQVSFLLFRGLVITFQEARHELFAPIRERLRGHLGRIRRSGADYLCYALMDTVVDHFYRLLEIVANSIEGMEADILRNPRQQHMHRIQELKGTVLMAKRMAVPMRELFVSVPRVNNGLFAAETLVFVRDVQDHITDIADSISEFHEILAVLMDLYLSSLGNHMNQVMKTLTLFASLFMPLTFLAGIYGMNFENMPELGWKYGYFAVLAIMALSAVGMFVYFRLKRWL